MWWYWVAWQSAQVHGIGIACTLKTQRAKNLYIEALFHIETYDPLDEL